MAREEKAKSGFDCLVDPVSVMQMTAHCSQTSPVLKRNAVTRIEVGGIWEIPAWLWVRKIDKLAFKLERQVKQLTC